MPEPTKPISPVAAKDNPLTKIDPNGSLAQLIAQNGNPVHSLPDAPTAQYSSSNDGSDKFVPPQSPLTNPPRPNRLGDWLTLADAATRGLDAYSTRRALQTKLNHEKILPDIISHSTPGMALYSGGITGVNYLGAKELEKHGHPKLANAVKMIDIGEDLPAAVNNLFLTNRQPPKPIELPPPIIIPKHW